MGRPSRPLRLLICPTAISPATLCTAAVAASGPVKARVPPIRTGGPEGAAAASATVSRTTTDAIVPRMSVSFGTAAGPARLGRGVDHLGAGRREVTRPHDHPPSVLDLLDLDQ